MVTIKIPEILNLDVTIAEQLLKLDEEVEEFKKAIELNDKENMIEEYYDIIQVMDKLIRLSKIENYDLFRGNRKHIRKLIERKWLLD